MYSKTTREKTSFQKNAKWTRQSLWSDTVLFMSRHHTCIARVWFWALLKCACMQWACCVEAQPAKVEIENGRNMCRWRGKPDVVPRTFSLFLCSLSVSMSWAGSCIALAHTPHTAHSTQLSIPDVRCIHFPDYSQMSNRCSQCPNRNSTAATYPYTYLYTNTYVSMCVFIVEFIKEVVVHAADHTCPFFGELSEHV